MARGRKPIPTKILQARGSWRGDARPDEPTPPSVRLVAPPMLTKEQKKFFRSCAAMLHASGITTALDAVALTRYAVIFSEWKKATDKINEGAATHIPVYADELGIDGKKKLKAFIAAPWYLIAVKKNQELLELEREFGMTPSSRSKIKVEKKVATMSDEDKMLYEMESYAAEK